MERWRDTNVQDLSIIIDELREEMIQTLKGWIQVPSVKAAPEPGAPFGREVRRALDLVLSDVYKRQPYFWA